MSDRPFIQEVFIRNLELLGPQVLLDLPALYTIYSDATNLPYLDGDRILLFSAEEYAKAAQDYLMQQLRMTTVMRVEQDYIDWFLKKAFYVNGAHAAIVDWGQQYYGNRAEFFASDPFVGDEKDRVRNPEFTLALTRLLQDVRWNANYEGRAENLKKLEDEMFRAFKTARFMIPVKSGAFPGENVKVDKITDTLSLTFAQLKTQDGSPATPLFTNVFAFDESYPLAEWTYHVMESKDLVYAPSFPVVIDPETLGFQLSKENIKILVKG